MDKIEIRDLEIFANHGVFPEETALGQKFVVSAVMYTETRPAGLTDDLSASINYGEVSHMITDFLQKNTYKLLEAVVENLAEMLLLSLPLLKKITLRIEKPWAPVGLPLKTVAVEITRGWHTAYVAFGSNMGDKKKYLDNAIQGLRDMKEIVVEKVSEYHTQSVKVLLLSSSSASVSFPAFRKGVDYASTPLFFRYSITAPTVVSSASSSDGISTSYFSSSAITSSNRSRESAPRSSLNEVVSVILLSSQFNCSAIISFISSNIVILLYTCFLLSIILVSNVLTFKV